METRVGGGYATEKGQQDSLIELGLINTGVSDLAAAIGSKDVVQTVLNNYGTTPVTTAAWVQLVAALTSTTDGAQIFDSTGEILEVGVGGAGAEVRKFLVTPGGNGNLAGCVIPAGSRVSIKAITANCNTAGTYLAINFFG